MSVPPTIENVLRERIAELEARLERSEALLEAVHEGGVDALVVSEPGGRVLFTRQGADRNYRSLVEALYEGAAMLAGDGLVVYANRRLAELLERPLEAVLGRPFAEFVPVPARPALEALLVAARERRMSCEIALQRADGVAVPVQLSVAAMAAAADAAFGIAVADLTQQKELQREIERYRNHLEQLVAERTRELEASRAAAEAGSRAKTAFLANMSHEIRTPLNAILGLTHLMLHAEVAPEIVSRLAKVDAAGHHLLSVINDILDVSKIEAGKLALEVRDFELGTLLAEVQALIAPGAADKGLEVAAECAEPHLVLCGDATRLKQGLLNYASNAVKFCDSGRVRLSAGVAEARAGRALVRFEVEDTGVGFDEQTRARLFQSFEQADSSTTRQHGGTGLGLAITKGLAEAMGGAAGASSEPGVGSRFWFTADLALGTPHAALPDAGTDALGELRARCAGRRVLLAEDNFINREVMVELLQGSGLLLDAVEDGEQAFTAVRDVAYDLVLMDLQMPKCDGLEATRLIRALPARLALPILALTASAFEDSREECAAAGMNGFITKPVDPDALYRTLLCWLPGNPALESSSA